MKRWRKRVIITDLVVFIPLVIGLFSLFYSFDHPWFSQLQNNKVMLLSAVGLTAFLAYLLHLFIRNGLVNSIAKTLNMEEPYGNIATAFRKNTRWYRPIFRSNPVGWGNGVRKKLDGIRNDIDQFVQTLNDRYTSPAGNKDN
jgi:hypothetical protein